LWTVVWNALDRAYWWVMHRTLKRFDRIYIRSLPPGYHDKDDMMLHGCFQLLVDWVEREKGLDWWDPEGISQQHHHKELRALYEWWTVERPKRYIDPDPKGLITGDGTIAEIENTVYIENVWEKEDQEQLERLVKCRGNLWT
jgi:hypothetical protein